MTMTQPIAAVLLAIFAAVGAGLYEPLLDPDADYGSFALWAAGCGVFVGWSFLGRRVGDKLWLSAFLGVQAVALTALVLATIMGVREVFRLGYRMRYDSVTEAFTGFFDIVVGWFRTANDQEFLITMGVGGVVIGVVLHVIARALEVRRNAR